MPVTTSLLLLLILCLMICTVAQLNDRELAAQLFKLHWMQLVALLPAGHVCEDPLLLLLASVFLIPISVCACLMQQFVDRWVYYSRGLEQGQRHFDPMGPSQQEDSAFILHTCGYKNSGIK